jgi:hypothetical protein
VFRVPVFVKWPTEWRSCDALLRSVGNALRSSFAACRDGTSLPRTSLSSVPTERRSHGALLHVDRIVMRNCPLCADIVRAFHARPRQVRHSNGGHAVHCGVLQEMRSAPRRCVRRRYVLIKCGDQIAVTRRTGVHCRQCDEQYFARSVLSTVRAFRARLCQGHCPNSGLAVRCCTL